jgi:threonine dehydrogenase-like Zn-dependent dehydrogenase
VGNQFNTAPFVIDELRVIGSRCGPIDQALNILAEIDSRDMIKPLDLQKYITKSFPLKEADQAIQFAAERSTMKVQIICSDLGRQDML